jgi:hypothetical protein
MRGFLSFHPRCNAAEQFSPHPQKSHFEPAFRATRLVRQHLQGNPVIVALAKKLVLLRREEIETHL